MSVASSVKPPGVLAAGVALVSLQRLNQHQLAVVVEHRRIDVVVRQVTAAVIRIVADEHIARTPVVVIAMLQPVAHRQLRYERQVRRADRAGRQATVSIDDAGVAFVGLVDDRRRRGAAQVRRRFEAHRLQRAANDARGHRIDRGRGRKWRAFGGKLLVQLE